MTSDALRARLSDSQPTNGPGWRATFSKVLDDLGDEDLTAEQWEAAWADEIRKRVDDLRAGRARTYSADDVIAELRARRGQGPR